MSVTLLQILKVTAAFVLYIIIRTTISYWRIGYARRQEAKRESKEALLKFVEDFKQDALKKTLESDRKDPVFDEKAQVLATIEDPSPSASNIPAVADDTFAYNSDADMWQLMESKSKLDAAEQKKVKGT